MSRLTIADLKEIKERRKAEFVMRAGGHRAKVTVHMGTCGIAAGARKVMDALLDEMDREKITDVIVTTSGCAGLCSREPGATVQIMNQPPLEYCDLDDAKIREIVRVHLLGGTPIEKYALGIGSETTQ